MVAGRCDERKRGEMPTRVEASGNLHKGGAQDIQVINTTPREGCRSAGHMFMSLQGIPTARWELLTERRWIRQSC